MVQQIHELAAKFQPNAFPPQPDCSENRQIDVAEPRAVQNVAAGRPGLTGQRGAEPGDIESRVRIAIVLRHRPRSRQVRTILRVRTAALRGLVETAGIGAAHHHGKRSSGLQGGDAGKLPVPQSVASNARRRAPAGNREHGGRDETLADIEGGRTSFQAKIAIVDRRAGFSWLTSRTVVRRIVVNRLSQRVRRL